MAAGPGKDAPAAVNAYIEIVPTITVKYELDAACATERKFGDPDQRIPQLRKLISAG